MTNTPQKGDSKLQPVPIFSSTTGERVEETLNFKI
jgi:hypothetical protein